MSTNLSAKYYQENKERLQKKLIKIFLQKKKEKSNKISEDEKQKLVEYGKILIE